MCTTIPLTLRRTCSRRRKLSRSDRPPFRARTTMLSRRRAVRRWAPLLRAVRWNRYGLNLMNDRRSSGIQNLPSLRNELPHPSVDDASERESSGHQRHRSTGYSLKLCDELQGLSRELVKPTCLPIAHIEVVGER